SMFLLSLIVGLVGGVATVITGGIGASFLGHAITRVAIFFSTGHAGQLAPRGTEPEEVERKRAAPIGWRSGERGWRGPLGESGPDRCSGAPGRAVRPLPFLGLDLPVLRLRRLRRRGQPRSPQPGRGVPRRARGRAGAPGGRPRRALRACATAASLAL